MGNGKAAEASAMINPLNGDLTVSKGEMKAIALKYCKDTLANNEPEEEFKELIETKKRSVESFLNLKGGSFKTSIATFNKNLKKFRNKEQVRIIKLQSIFQNQSLEFFLKAIAGPS